MTVGQTEPAADIEVYESLASSIPALVMRQLDHLPTRLREHSGRDDFCMGYALGALFHVLEWLDLSTTGLAAQATLLLIFRRLYAADGDRQLAIAMRHAHELSPRFTAGMVAGACDMADCLAGGRLAKRLYGEFSLPEPAGDLVTAEPRPN